MSRWLSLQAVARQLDRTTVLVLVVWALVFISVPILRWTFGDPGLTVGITLGVIAQVGAVLFVLSRAWGIRAALMTALIVIAAGWAVEFVGHTTGFPFGGYDYTPRFQPQFGGVPLLIPLAWMMMMPPAWAMAQLITGKTRGIAFVLMSAVAMTAWDFFLDPQMVTWGAWVFDDPGAFAYVGLIPWTNFLGWLLASALITLVARPHALPLLAMFIIYVITWALHLIGQLFFWGLPVSGVVGGVIMGAVILAGIIAMRKRAE
ncbi:MAG: carotenoid biosynthesis protein [Chloroflexota bacterium]|nr:carotenoid biosynthesis protein [Chloroflexota bacterium]